MAANGGSLLDTLARPAEKERSEEKRKLLADTNLLQPRSRVYRWLAYESVTPYRSGELGREVIHFVVRDLLPSSIDRPVHNDPWVQRFFSTTLLAPSDLPAGVVELPIKISLSFSGRSLLYTQCRSGWNGPCTGRKCSHPCLNELETELFERDCDTPVWTSPATRSPFE